MCYIISKLRLNRRSGKKKKLNKQQVKEERGVLKSNIIEIKAEKTLGLDMTSRSFTLILSNVQLIKIKQDIITELLEDSNADLAVLTETWLTDTDDFGFRDQNSIDVIIKLMNGIGKTEKGEA